MRVMLIMSTFWAIFDVLIFFKLRIGIIIIFKWSTTLPYGENILCHFHLLKPF